MLEKNRFVVEKFNKISIPGFAEIKRDKSSVIFPYNKQLNTFIIPFFFENLKGQLRFDLISCKFNLVFLIENNIEDDSDILGKFTYKKDLDFYLSKNDDLGE